MGVEIDWSKAPEGATHYMPDSDKHYACWVKIEGVNHFTMLADGFDKEWELDNKDWEYISLIPRQCAWTGEGLPPVGEIIEWLDGKFLKAVVVGHQQGAVVAVADDDPRSDLIGKKPCYRPLRTPEQIAAEEREKAIDAILDDLSLSPECRYIAKRVHEAGYRKVTP